ncbi:hypothetical protein [Desulfobacula phenolica]|uniref:Uncharacterized protein n=1 Tax=Desulfobacula phenolica TaxID=90732 RepID=A0A1H2H649_9BACT|nr:hypothetical protein [Desulfobacula phenolica]SDU27357.1 hypothetical protein SAMN04487931_10668 [Desulfobacula phenolica]
MYTKQVLKDLVSTGKEYNSFSPLYLTDKKARPGCILKNTLCPPYKKPPLPFGVMTAKVHGLLRPLKIAHTLMAREILRTAEIFPAEYFPGRVLYETEKAYHPDVSHVRMFRECFENQVGMPFLVAGFVIDHLSRNTLYYSFDSTPFYSEYRDNPDYSDIDVSEIQIKPLKTAAGFYNECAEALYEAGFIIMPTSFIDVLDGFLPPDTIHKDLPVFEI